MVFQFMVGDGVWFKDQAGTVVSRKCIKGGDFLFDDYNLYEIHFLGTPRSKTEWINEFYLKV